MLETKEQKQVFFGSLVLIAILLAVSFWDRDSLLNINKPLRQDSNSDVLNSAAYLKYFKEVQADQKASQELFETLLTKEDIRREVENKLEVRQNIAPPEVDSKKIQISSNNTQAALTEYLKSSVAGLHNFHIQTSAWAQDMFGGGVENLSHVNLKLDNLVTALYNISVPSEAQILHKELIATYLAYGDLLEAAKSFNPENPSANNDLWPKVYKTYAIANNSAKIYSAELSRVAGKYKITVLNLESYADRGEESDTGNFLVPAAHAILGVGDFSITVGDIPRIIMDAVKEGLRSSFLQFMGTMLDNMIAKIEKNYVIANFLYYSDALVNAQYADDYLNKYVADPFDRAIVKKLLPQFNCGKNPDLKPVFLAKANEYLGFNPGTVSPADPNYYEKMARVGHFMSSPTGWQTYYGELAAQTESQAQRAIERELVSSGLKTPRSIGRSSISSSISSIVSAERAGFTALLQLGINNTESVIGNLVGSLTQTLVNKFVFQGVATNSGSIGVVKEQSQCVSAAIISPVLPLPTNEYKNPTTAPNEQELLERYQGQ